MLALLSISKVVVIVTLKTQLREFTWAKRRVIRPTQSLLLSFQVREVLIVHFWNAVDAHACCEHIPKLAHNCGNDPQVALPVKLIPYLNAWENQRVQDWVHPQQEQTEWDSQRRPRQEGHLLTLGVKVESGCGVNCADGGYHAIGFPIVEVDIFSCFCIDSFALGRKMGCGFKPIKKGELVHLCRLIL